jgi:hypothetical protein
MKRLLLIILLIAGAGVGGYYYTTGSLPTLLLTGDEKKVAQLRESFEAARVRIRQTKRAAISGVDTSGMGDGSAAEIDEFRRDLMVLRAQLKSSDAKDAAQKLLREIEAFRFEVK